MCVIGFGAAIRLAATRADTLVLGLSLCQELAERLGARFSVDSETGGQFVVRLELPVV